MILTDYLAILRLTSILRVTLKSDCVLSGQIFSLKNRVHLNTNDVYPFQNNIFNCEIFSGMWKPVP